jgi:DnaJ-domain-containing protein 1
LVVAAGQFFRPAAAAESTMAWSKFGSFKVEKGDSAATAGAVVQRRDPYEVLEVEQNTTEQEIKSAFRHMALK